MKIDKKTKDKIIDLWTSGLVVGLISKELKITKGEIQKIINAHGASSSMERYGNKKKKPVAKKVNYALEKIKLNDSKNTVIEVRKSLSAKKKREIKARYMESLKLNNR